ncbi:hypothetical protein IEZ26_03335 [Nocardioides cavernae]|uniref:Uncharacterized protein n=1 Tax=Nocardioides cavernae TaxID=1921566 RepID=A0ABR8N7V8_9ACTN|nr:hypothetical protein [Nocardioides cavernae]MBD3923641.1 hypothetical protein [Nocardioides cavernae]MBM7511428.1 hypothetical protein [Nocardioides cavernae]
MSETTSTVQVVDEQARFRAFTALGLALSSLAGGGVFMTSFQWLAMKFFNDNGNDQLYWIGVAVGPLVMGCAALWLSLTDRSSADMLARPLARAALVLSALAVVGALLLLALTAGGV